MKIPVVDNGGQWTHREWRVLRYLGVDTEIIPNTIPLEELCVDGIVLSGGAASVSLENPELGNCGDYLERANFPILAICLSHQFTALHLGGKVGPSETPEFGLSEVTLVNGYETDPLFKDIPQNYKVWTSHNDEILALPENFIVLASTPTCKVQAMRHKEKPIYGLQFHPEVEHTEHGYKHFENFVDVCRIYKSN